jgi:hypothetical protein
VNARRLANATEYHVTQAAIRDFQDALDQPDKEPAAIDPLIRAAMRTALAGDLAVLQELVADFEYRQGIAAWGQACGAGLVSGLLPLTDTAAWRARVRRLDQRQRTRAKRRAHQTAHPRTRAVARAARKRRGKLRHQQARGRR